MKVIKVGPEEYEKIRIGKSLINIRDFILLISILLSSIIFLIGIVSGLYLDAYLLASLLAVCFSIAVFPTLIYTSMKTAKDQKILDYYPAFLRDLAESLASGMTILQAFAHLSKMDYGPLTPFINKLYVWLSWGVPFEKAFQKFNEYFKDIPLIRRANGIILEVYLQGGNIERTLKTVANDLESLRELEKLKKSYTSQQIIVLYVIYFIFAGLLIMLQNVLEPLISAQMFMSLSQQAGIAGGFTFQPIDLQHFKLIASLALIIQAIFIALIMGVAETGKPSAGFKHLTITLLAAIILILVFILPEKVNLDLRVYPTKVYVGQPITVEITLTIDAIPTSDKVFLSIPGVFVGEVYLENGRYKISNVTFTKPGKYVITARYIRKLKEYVKTVEVEVLG